LYSKIFQAFVDCSRIGYLAVSHTQHWWRYMLLEYVISSTPKTRIQFKWIEPAIKEKLNLTLNHHEKPQLSWSFVRSDLFSLWPNLCKNLVFLFLHLRMFHSHCFIHIQLKICLLCSHINYLRCFWNSDLFIFHSPSLIDSSQK